MFMYYTYFNYQHRNFKFFNKRHNIFTINVIIVNSEIHNIIETVICSSPHALISSFFIVLYRDIEYTMTSVFYASRMNFHRLKSN